MSIVPISTGNPIDSNMWLVLGSSAVLIDTGTGVCDSFSGESYADAVARSIRPYLGGRELDTIILTHSHIDHAGGCNALSRVFGSEVYIGEGEADVIRSADRLYSVADMFSLPFLPTECQGVGEGYVFDIGEHRLRVIDTPGHTKGGICLYDEVTGSLFSGDTLFSAGVGRTDLPGGSFPRLAESLAKLRNVNISGLYPGHGPSTSDGKTALEQALNMVGYL